MFRSPNRQHERQYFFKYMTAAVAKIVITSRKLRWSSPVLFNDPFDVTQELRLNFDEAILLKIITDKMTSMIEAGTYSNSVKHPELSILLNMIEQYNPAIRLDLANKIRGNLVPPTTGQKMSFKALKEQWGQMVPTFRVLCLSEINDVTSMWLHYADKYRGVVLEFSAVDELDSGFLMARPIIYQDDPPLMANPETWASCMLGQGDITYKDIFKEYLYIKTLPWAYEREWRIVSGARLGETGLFGDYGFHPKELTGVYFGPNSSVEDRAEISALLTHGLEHVKIYSAYTDNARARFLFRDIQ